MWGKGIPTLLKVVIVIVVAIIAMAVVANVVLPILFFSRTTSHSSTTSLPLTQLSSTSTISSPTSSSSTHPTTWTPKLKVISSLTLIPDQGGIVGDLVLTGGPYNTEPMNTVGYVDLTPNLWNLNSAQSQGNATVIYNSTQRALYMVANFTRLEINQPVGVAAYMEVIYGYKPWGVRTLEAPNFTFPERVSDLGSLLSFVNYTLLYHSPPQAFFDLAYDLWITTRPDLTNGPKQGDLELMIWDYYYGQQPAGSQVGVLQIPIWINGTEVNATYEIWATNAETTSNSWTILSFRPSYPIPYGQVGVNVSAFIQDGIHYLAQNYPGLWNLSSLESKYLNGLEFGTEFGNTQTHNISLAWVIHSFTLGRTAMAQGGIEGSPSYYPVVLWVVPWGLGNRVVPNWAIPGVVLPYQCNEPSQTANWENSSLSLIREFRDQNRTVFVNLFCEIYYPSYKWRGSLNYIQVPENIVEALKRISPTGAGLYLGFSEETACVSNSTCRTEMVSAYDQLRSAMPEAKLFYYGSGGDNPKDLILLYTQAKLDLIGYDIWDYTYNGTVWIAPYLLKEIQHLQTSGVRLMIGEIGFRYCDPHAYYQAWNWNLNLTGNCRAAAQYMAEALNETSLDMHPQVIGIWAWNDPSFGLVRNPQMEAAVLEYAEFGYVPLY